MQHSATKVIQPWCDATSRGNVRKGNAAIKSDHTLAEKMICIKPFPHKQLKIIARQKTKVVCFGEIWKIDATANKTASTLLNAE